MTNTTNNKFELLEKKVDHIIEILLQQPGKFDNIIDILLQPPAIPPLDESQNTNEPFKTVEEISDKYRMHPQTIYNSYKSGKIPGYRLGRKILFKESEVLREFKRKQHA